jgi:hypothetical protein
LRRIFGSKRDEITRECRKLHDGELNDLYSSPHIFRMMKSRRMGWEGYVAHIWGEEMRIDGFGGKIWEKETTWKTQV